MIDPENPYTKMQREFYAREAAKWSPTNRDPVVGSFDLHNAWSDYDLLFAGLDTQNMVALDFGCGPGRMMVKYAPKFRRIDGADLDFKNLQNAQLHMLRNGIDSGIVNLYETKGTDLYSVPDTKYDLVYSTICLQHIPVHTIRLNLFREFFRVLKPGGWFTAQMGYDPPDETRGSEYYADYWDAPTTNTGADARVQSESQLGDDLAKLGFICFSTQIRESGPNDWHKNWIFFRAQKPEGKD